MSLKVIGAGFGRTGTLSLKRALEELRLGPCYHMIEVNAHPEHDALWLALAKGESSDWRPMLKGYASTVDWPTTSIWKALAAANPQARIILTLRDPEAWYASAAATIFARMLEFVSMRASPDAVDPVRRRHMEMINTLIVENTFGGSLAKEHAIAVFNAHNEEVRRLVPRKQLLVYESGEGWEPLCAFLDAPIPTTPYPKVNTTDDFASHFPGKR
ncbi:MAG TPA: sulfotransferase [Methyloceanibacter sp.]|nr:sulfotransferase [Methyloceanibacter sp.]